MSAERRTIFWLGARLCMSAAAVESLSRREVAGWIRYFSDEAAARAAANDDAVSLETLSRDELRAMFHHDPA
jgi:hypothetical protein